MAMRRLLRYGGIAALCTAAGFASGLRPAPPEADVKMESKACFTRVNIWYEKQDAIPSTNYHSGEILPAATPVKILAVGKKKIRFAVEGKGEFTIDHMTEHSPVELTELFEQYFSESDPVAPDGKFHSFTKEEQRHIVNGTLAAGMGREAVLMAYGYPPSHKTPKLEAETWKYWIGKWRSHDITFDKDGKLKSF